ADVSSDRLKRFFLRVNSSYQIARSVRDCCIFARQNVTKDPPFSKLDLILCRNVLIYLGPVLQNTVMRLFHYALSANGFLVLGLSESTGGADALFTPQDKKLKIYARKHAPAHIETNFGVYEENRLQTYPKKIPEGAAQIELQRKIDNLL